MCHFIHSEDGGSGALCVTTMHGGADVQNHQGDTGIRTILTAGIRKCQRRVLSGQGGVEFEANSCVGQVSVEREQNNLRWQ